jgi:hypothetical protein
MSCTEPSAGPRTLTLLFEMNTIFGMRNGGGGAGAELVAAKCMVSFGDSRFMVYKSEAHGAEADTPQPATSLPIPLSAYQSATRITEHDKQGIRKVQKKGDKTKLTSGKD